MRWRSNRDIRNYFLCFQLQEDTHRAWPGPGSCCKFEFWAFGTNISGSRPVLLLLNSHRNGSSSLGRASHAPTQWQVLQEPPEEESRRAPPGRKTSSWLRAAVWVLPRPDGRSRGLTRGPGKRAGVRPGSPGAPPPRQLQPSRVPSGSFTFSCPHFPRACCSWQLASARVRGLCPQTPGSALAKQTPGPPQPCRTQAKNRRASAPVNSAGEGPRRNPRKSPSRQGARTPLQALPSCVSQWALLPYRRA